MAVRKYVKHAIGLFIAEAVQADILATDSVRPVWFVWRILTSGRPLFGDSP